MSFPIDAVITWVDGSDPQLAAKRKRYAPELSLQENDVAGATRYANDGEIYLCVESLLKFAPFLRRIWIVTDGQDPHIPEGNIPVTIVDHKEIFTDGYGRFLPVFNSVAIESMTWRIPGLAEHYLELNDDFLLCRPLSPDDFFDTSGNPLCYAVRASIPLTRLTRAIKKSENGHRKVTFKGLMVNGAVLAGARLWYLRINHTPRALSRVWFEEWFSKHPEALEHNVSFRFRNPDQFSPEELQYVSLWEQGKLKVLPIRKNLFYMETRRGKDYIRHKLDRFRKGSYKFLCLNSLDRTSPDDLRLIDGLVEEILG